VVEGFIDSASAYEVVLVFARKKPRHSYRMEWESALGVTSILISADHIKLAPSPKPEGAASGAYGLFLKGLEPTISRIVLPELATSAAVRKTKKWAGESIEKLQSVLQTFTNPVHPLRTNEAALWLEAHIENEWCEHVLRRGALFDREFTSQIARVLAVPEPEILTVWSRTADANFVAELAKRRPDTDTYRTIRDAFIVSALLRGRYHDYAAENAGAQILSHPIRNEILRKSPRGNRVPIEISNTERYLANIVVASAFAERSHAVRVSLWVENVLKLRSAREGINLGQKDRDETARDVAIDAAHRADIRLHSKLLENVLDASFALGGAAITSFVLLPWESMVIGSGMYAFSAKKKVGARFAGAIASAAGKLNRLSKLMPGRIER
jgi:hypothetical protein